MPMWTLETLEVGRWLASPAGEFWTTGCRMIWFKICLTPARQSRMQGLERNLSLYKNRLSVRNRYLNFSCPVCGHTSQPWRLKCGFLDFCIIWWTFKYLTCVSTLYQLSVTRLTILINSAIPTAIRLVTHILTIDCFVASWLSAWCA